MTADPRTVDTSATLADAAREMRDGDVGSVVVVENGKVAGIVTDRDIAVRVVAQGLDPDREERPAGIVSLGDLAIERDTDSALADIASEPAST